MTRRHIGALALAYVLIAGAAFAQNVSAPAGTFIPGTGMARGHPHDGRWPS